jgi:proline dehydrogenase
MRRLLLYLSRHGGLRHWMETSPLAWRLASRFVAGERPDDALRVSRRINGEGIMVTLDRLGENVTSADEAAAARDGYIETVERLVEAGIRGNVSIKLTQFGMDLSEDICRRNVEQLVRTAAALGSFVRVDMESSEYTDRTLSLVEDLHASYGAVGAVIQSYLFRSKKDVERLCARGIRIRLCKGAYLEPATVAFPRKSDVDTNFVQLMEHLLREGTYPAIATHDERMIEATERAARLLGISPEQFEFQMLYGIRRDIQARLVREGYRLRLYVPFGTAWYPYFMRRLAERPANVFFLARNLLKT